MKKLTRRDYSAMARASRAFKAEGLRGEVNKVLTEYYKILKEKSPKAVTSGHKQYKYVREYYDTGDSHKQHQEDA